MSNVEQSPDNKESKGLKDISRIMTNMVVDNTKARLGQSRLCHEKEIQMKDKAYADQISPKYVIEKSVIKMLCIVRETLQELPLNKIDHDDRNSVKGVLILILKDLENGQVTAG
jgi:hypothetical protein